MTEDVRAMVRQLMKSPEATLLAMAGGVPRTIAGRTLDPRIQLLEAQSKSQPQAPLAPDTAREGARVFAATCGGDREAGVAVEDLQIPGPAGTIAARAYRSQSQDPNAALIVYYHQGGGVIGDLDFCDCFCTILAAEARTAVVSVDYRLAPEHPWPAGEEDAVAAYRWAVENASRFGARAGGAAVGGDSMGGYLSAVISQRMAHQAGPMPVAQLLIYPATELASQTPSMTEFAEAFPLNREMMEWFMSLYLPAGVSADDPRVANPARGDLAGQPPAFVYTAGFDPLVDQGDLYAKALAAAGVPTTHRRYDTLSHAFTAMTGIVPAADAACREIARELAPALRA